MAASSEEAPRKIPSRERTVAQMAIVFRGVHLPCASKDCLDLLSRGAASIAFYLASAHCNGSESLSLRHRTYISALHANRAPWLPRIVTFPAGAQSSERYPANKAGDSRRRFRGCDIELPVGARQPVSSIRIAFYMIRMRSTIPPIASDPTGISVPVESRDWKIEKNRSGQ